MTLLLYGILAALLLILIGTLAVAAVLLKGLREDVADLAEDLGETVDALAVDLDTIFAALPKPAGGTPPLLRVVSDLIAEDRNAWFDEVVDAELVEDPAPAEQPTLFADTQEINLGPARRVADNPPTEPIGRHRQ